MKKLTSIFLVLIIFITQISGCSDVNANTILTYGQWLSLICESFGMESYQTKEPLFENVKEDSPYFAFFQACGEWNVIDTECQELTPETKMTWSDVIVSLVNAGEFLDETTSEKEKIYYGIKYFDRNIRDYKSNRFITVGEAVPLLDKVQNMWATRTYSEEEKIEKIVFNESVKDFSKDDDLKFSANDNKVIGSDIDFGNLKEGDIYVLPETKTSPAKIQKVKSIKSNDGVIEIENYKNLSNEEILESIPEMQIRETVPLDFGNVVGIYDENNNPIDFEIDNSISDNTIKSKMQKVGLFDNAKGKFTIKKKGKDGKYWNINLSVAKDDLSVEVSKEILKSSNRFREQKSKVFAKAKINDVSITKDFEKAFGTVIKEATVRVDYNVTIEGGLSISKEGKIGDYSIWENDDIVVPLDRALKQYASSLNQLKKEVRNNANNEDIYICKLKVLNGYLGSLDFIVRGSVSAEGEFKIVIECEGGQGIQYKNNKLRYIKTQGADANFVAEGKIELTMSPGVAIFILDSINLVEFSIDVGAGAKIEFVAHLVDVEWHKIHEYKTSLDREMANDLEKDYMYVTKESLKKFAEEQGGTINDFSTDTKVQVGSKCCIVWSLYPIVRIGLSEGLIVKIAKDAKLSLNCSVLGENNTILKGHIDFPNNLDSALNSSSIGDGLVEVLGIGKECTYDFKPWDTVQDPVDEDKAELIQDNEDIEDIFKPNADVKNGKILGISHYRITLQKNETKDLFVECIPSGLDLSDVNAYVEDTTIATYNLKTMQVTAKEKPGTTIVVFETKDKKYKVSCVVSVVDDAKINIGKLPKV